jgi:hypothetical protein
MEEPLDSSSFQRSVGDLHVLVGSINHVLEPDADHIRDGEHQNQNGGGYANSCKSAAMV